MKKRQILLIGTGGQGIKTLGKIIARAAFLAELDPSVYTLYTPSARGSACVSSVIISGSPRTYPLVETADLALILSSLVPEELIRIRAGNMFIERVSGATRILYDRWPDNLNKNPAKATRLPGITAEPFSNIRVLGAITPWLKPLEEPDLIRAIKAHFGEKAEGALAQYREGRQIKP